MPCLLKNIHFCASSHVVHALQHLNTTILAGESHKDGNDSGDSSGDDSDFADMEDGEEGDEGKRRKNASQQRYGILRRAFHHLGLHSCMRIEH